MSSPDKNKKNKSNGFFVEMGKEEDKKEEINVSYISTINMNPVQQKAVQPAVKNVAPVQTASVTNPSF